MLLILPLAFLACYRLFPLVNGSGTLVQDVDSKGLHLCNNTIVMSWEAVSGFVSGILTFASLCLVAVIYYFDSRSDRQAARREIYQQLELASIDLFRFECERPELVALLWDDKATPLEQLPAAQQYAVRAYVFQILNLFEMAIRFRVQGIMDPDVFGSWIIWMYELCSASRFQRIWREVHLNYVGLLAESLSTGIRLCESKSAGGPDMDSQAEFFRMFKKTLHCRSLDSYIARLQAGA